MPKMPPAVRKCQTFTTHYPPYQICTLPQTRIQHKCIHYRRAQIHSDTPTHKDTNTHAHMPLDTQHDGGNLISQRVYGTVLVGSGLAQSGSCERTHSNTMG